MLSPFVFPKIHSFPPIYTKQPNATILTSQYESWTRIILEYCQYYQITLISWDGEPLYLQINGLDIDKIPSLFENPGLERSCSFDFRHAILSHLINHQHCGDYIDSKHPKRGLHVFYNAPDKLGDILYLHISDSGQLGTIFTIYELTCGDMPIPNVFRNMDSVFLGYVLKRTLVRNGKAHLLLTDDEIGGVKFI